MARPWYSFYPADYVRDTGHLTLAEHGAHRLLMDHYYANETPLPDDESRLLRLTRARSGLEKQAVRLVLREFFELGAEGWRHKRIDAEIVKAVETSARSSFGARAGATGRQRNAGGQFTRTPAGQPADGPADGPAVPPAESQPSQSQSPSQSQKTDSLFEEFWSAFPRKEARGAAAAAWGRAVEMAGPQTLIAAAKAYAAKRVGQDARFTRSPTTWLMQQCWLDDPPAPDAPDAQEAARAWDGEAARLVAEIGPALFVAYFGAAEFSRGPPAVIRVGKLHLAAMIARRFSGALTRAYGEFSLEA